MRLLLCSNSTMPGEPYLAWTLPYLRSYLEGIEQIVFVPYAGVGISHDDYTQRVAAALPEKRVTGLHTLPEKRSAIEHAQAILVGGGNTFCLLERCQKEGLLRAMVEAVTRGVPYGGWSAGANLACPTIKTTNDMPIVATDGLEALNLVPFQINPHFTDATVPGHGGESREQRIQEYLIQNPSVPVLGLPEGMLIEVAGDVSTLRGVGEARLFRPNQVPVSIPPGPFSI